MIQRYTLLVLLTILWHCYLPAQKKAKSSSPKPPELVKDSTKSKGPVTMQDTLKNFKAYKGLFDLYQDTISGSLMMKIKKDQVDKEYIYFSHTADGVLPSGHHRGSFRYNKIFSIRRYFNRIELVMENTGYYFNPENAISKSAGANINRPVLASLKILKEDKSSGDLLVSADQIFLAENFDPIKPFSSPGQGQRFDPGKFSKEKSKYTQIRNYPANTDLVIEYVYENNNPQNWGSKEVTDPRYTTIKLQHSWIEVPPAGYTPRKDDPRVGFFMTQVEDMTANDATPYQDIIHRWRLEKKDKAAAKSEPVQPIVWWIENTTPKELRQTIKDAGLRWNEAFEEAGFINAVEIREQPDDADWDAGDIRYNVLRWTSSPQPPFGGYGPSFVNPRTGEILGADIMLEYIFVTNRLQQERLFEAAALGLESPKEFSLPGEDHKYCTLGHHLHHATQFGALALDALNLPEVEKTEYLKASLYYLVLHEMGHTLGLMHNMRASQLWSPELGQNKTITEKAGLIGSVMDYPAANVSPDKSKQGQYFTTRPGPYDRWAIQYGYSDATESDLLKLLKRSTEPALCFGNDADDMRSVGRGIDPRVMINDMSSDAIRFAEGRINLVNSMMPGLLERYGKKEDSWHEFRNAYLLLTGELATSARVISRYIGGVYVDRAFAGQEGATQPFSPVSLEDQQRAMKVLAEKILAPDAFKTSANIYTHLQLQRRGFNPGEDPKIHDRVLNIQKEVLSHVIHPNTLKRMTDAQLYGNKYSADRMLQDVTDAIFKSDLTGAVNTMRQNLQQEWVENLIAALEENSEYDGVAKAQIWAQLLRIENQVKNNLSGDQPTQNHRKYISWKIKQAMED